MTDGPSLELAASTAPGPDRGPGADAFLVWRDGDAAPVARGPVDPLHATGCASLSLSGSPGVWLVVADGMGPPDAARSATERALDALVAALAETAGAALAVHARLDRALAAANRASYDASLSEPRRGSAVQVVVAWTDGRRLALATVGSPRAHVARGGHLVRVTETFARVSGPAPSAADDPALSSARAAYDEGLALGLLPTIRPRPATLALRDGDTLLLCTEALACAAEPDALARAALEAPDLPRACESLLARAAEAGVTEDRTALLARVRGGSDAADDLRAAPHTLVF